MAIVKWSFLFKNVTQNMLKLKWQAYNTAVALVQ